MFNKVRFISLSKLKQHEILQTIRIVFPKTENWNEAYSCLCAAANKAQNRLGKAIGVIIAYYFVLRNFDRENEIIVTLGNFSASLPTLYIAAAGSFAFFAAILGFTNFWVLMLARASFGTRVRRHGFSVETYAQLMGNSDYAAGIPLHQNNFFNDKMKATSGLTLIFSLVLAIGCMPFLAFGYYLLIVIEQNTNREILLSFDNFVAAFGFFNVSCSFIYLVFFLVPLPHTKATLNVRFSFLNRISLIFPHPQIKNWLREL